MDMNHGFALPTDGGRFASVLPEVLMPTQYADMCRNTAARSPELLLRLAVLEDAVRCYQHYADRPELRARRIFGETQEWFAAEQPEEPYSFVTICAVLGIDPDYVRDGLQRWRTQGLPPRRAGHVVPRRRRRSGTDSDKHALLDRRAKQSA